MQKGIWLLSMLILLAGCNEQQKITVYKTTDDQQQAEEIQQLLEEADAIEQANIVFLQNELFVALQLKPFEKWNKQKLEKKWKDKLEKQFPDERVHVSADFKLFWESGKLMDEKDQTKVLDKLQQLKQLAKEET